MRTLNNARFSFQVSSEVGRESGSENAVRGISHSARAANHVVTSARFHWSSRTFPHAIGLQSNYLPRFNRFRTSKPLNEGLLAVAVSVVKIACIIMFTSFNKSVYSQSAHSHFRFSFTTSHFLSSCFDLLGFT